MEKMIEFPIGTLIFVKAAFYFLFVLHAVELAKEMKVAVSLPDDGECERYINIH